MRELQPQVWDIPRDNSQPKGLSIFQQVLWRRGYRDQASIEEFCASKILPNFNPFNFKDMHEACLTLKLALLRQERIVVYGDYDADGITASALLTTYLRELGADVVTIIPDRLSDGYGLSFEMIEKVMEYSPGLVITVDCGVVSVEEVARLRKMSVNVIITDHHQPKAKLPEANAIINAQVADSGFDFKGLSGVGTAYCLIKAYDIIEKHRLTDNPFYLALVAIGTVADQMQLVAVNRDLVKKGLEAFSLSNQPSIIALRSYIGLQHGDTVLSDNVSFKLAPLLNSGGRMGAQYLPFNLLMAKSSTEASNLITELVACNEKRRQVEKDTFAEACQIIDANSAYQEAKMLVITSETWHRGVLGLLASRLVECYHKPVVVMTRQSETEYVGSGRSYLGINLLESLRKHQSLTKELGGHVMAIGLTVEADALASFVEATSKSELVGDTSGDKPHTLLPEVVLSDDNLITWQDALELQQLEPYGQGNAMPLFAFCNLKVVAMTAKTETNTLLLQLQTQGGVRYRAIGFRLGVCASYLKLDCQIDVLCECKLNTWRGNTSVELFLRSIRPTAEPARLERMISLVNAYVSGQCSLPQIANAMSCKNEALSLPTRKWLSIFYQWLVKEFEGSGGVNLSILRLAIKFGKAVEQPAEPIVCLLALVVFSELGIIGLQFEKTTINLSFYQPGVKKSLTESGTYRRWQEV